MSRNGPSPEAIRRERKLHPSMRERDLANQLGISEAEFIAAWCGMNVRRIEPDVSAFLNGAGALGEVMALTRNESAVHEKIGVYDKVFPGKHSAMVLGDEIDLRIFPASWAHGFAVEKQDGDAIRRSLQFFNASGEAVHKVHLRPASNVDAYEKLVDELVSADQTQSVAVSPTASVTNGDEAPLTQAQELREGWSAMTDVHQFHGLLRRHKLSRRQAVHMVGEDYAWRLDASCVSALFANAVNEAIPIMCFVGNDGCIQIHSGPIVNVKPMGPWITVMDPAFHLHLRADHVAEVWVVRKPTKDGHVTSVELYGADHEMIIQFFGKRKEGQLERDEWRLLAENLPRLPASSAA